MWTECWRSGESFWSPALAPQFYGMALLELLYSYGHLCKCSQLSCAGSQPVSASTQQPVSEPPPGLQLRSLRARSKAGGVGPLQAQTPPCSVHADRHCFVLPLTVPTTQTCQPKHRALREETCFSISFSVISSRNKGSALVALF